MTSSGSVNGNPSAAHQPPALAQVLLGDETASAVELDASLADIVEQVGKITKPKQAMEFFCEKTFAKVGGQQLTGRCVFCKMSITSSGAQRLVTHLARCMCAPNIVLESFQSLLNQKELNRNGKRQQEADIRDARDSNRRDIEEHRQRNLVQQGLRGSMKTLETQVADQAIGNFFYANGLSFAAASSDKDSYYKEMVAAIKASPSNYLPPSRFQLADRVLDDCHATMHQKLKKMDPEGMLAEKYGAAYVSDGWDSVDHLPLVNSAFICANDGGRYWRSVDTSGYTKNAEYLAALMISDIYDFGCTKVVSVVTDTCSTMRKAWEIVEDEFPWISILPCQAHVVSLLMKDIAQLDEAKQLIAAENTVVTWFSNHHKPLAIFRQKSADMLGKTYQFVKAGLTRMGTHTLVGERLLKVKAALQATVVDPEYVAQGYRDLPDEVESGNCEQVVREHKAATTKQAVLDDTGFWARVEDHVAVTKPIYKLLRRHDSSAPTVGKLYSGWFEIGETLKKSKASYKDDAFSKMEDRWAYGHADLASAAYVVDPEFAEHDQSTNEEVMAGFMNTVEKIGILLEVRKQEEKYTEQWKKRRDLIHSDPKKQVCLNCLNQTAVELVLMCDLSRVCSIVCSQKSFDHYPKYPGVESKPVKEFAVKVNAQLSLYKNKKGVFSRSWVFDAAAEMPAYLWWDANGASTPELQAFARIVLAQPASASIIERINSEFAFVKDRKRNRLQHEKANKLVDLFHNLRLMKRMNKPAYAEPAVGWNVEEMESGITKWGVANYA